MYKDKNPEFRRKKPYKTPTLYLSAKNQPELFSSKKLENYNLEKTIGRGTPTFFS